MFCKMREEDFIKVIKIRDHYYRINNLEGYFYYYRFELLRAAYDFIHDSKKIDKDSKEPYLKKRYLEKKIRRKINSIEGRKRSKNERRNPG